jgi:hypothetical protein
VQWSLLLVALIAYAYFIMISVVQIVLRQELHVSIQEAETRISELESTYFERANTLSREKAGEFGLVAVTPTAYVNVASEGDRLTRRDN